MSETGAVEMPTGIAKAPLWNPASTPWAGLAAALLGAFISTLNTRLSTFGLADIRGAVHAGFDDGAWITTAQSAAQMLVAPLAVWMGGAYGARRVLLEAATAFAVISFLEPFSPNLPTLLALQFAAGLASGFFVPLTLSFILKSTPPKVWAYGVAIFALNLEVSLNVSASLEGWYIEHHSWRWIFWQNVPLAVAMAACLGLGMRPEPPNPNRPRLDRYGLATCGLGLALIYAALDQGNRLDWTNSKWVWGLSIAGLILLAGFLVHARRWPNPALDLKAVFAPPMPRLLLLIMFLRLTLLSTGYVIPQFLQVVRGFRALEVGQTLVWLALPQLIICFLVGLFLRRFDSRLVASSGFVCICLACLMVGHGLGPLWGSDQFLPSQLLQAVGQSLALSGILFFAVLHLKPAEALTFGAAAQIARLMGGEIGQAFIATFVRKRGQIASNLIGQHVQIGDGAVLNRLQSYASATSSAGDASSGTVRGATVLSGVVRSAATTQGIIDALILIAALTALTLVIIVTRRAAPGGPATHVSMSFGFGRRRSES